MQVRFASVRFRVTAILFVATLAACGGNSPVPRGENGAVPPASVAGGVFAAKPKPTPSPTPKPTLPPDQIVTALESIETYYARLPHADPATDLETLASYVRKQKAFSSAQLTPGGLTVQFSDGRYAMIFGDHLEETKKEQSDAAIPRSTVAAQPLASAPHEIAFLVKNDGDAAFSPSRQLRFAATFPASGWSSSRYASGALGVSLGNILALKRLGPLDWLDVATHGAVSVQAKKFSYVWLSTTPVNPTTMSTYALDFSKNDVMFAVVLYARPKTLVLPTFAFTPNFLTAHLAFNSGAIVDNQSCFGQNPLIAADVAATLAKSGVATYLGWTKSVGGNDADETDAFLLDRLLGERVPSVTLLNQYVHPRMPPQRPFSLAQVISAISTVTRSGIISDTSNVPYSVSNLHDPLNLPYPPLSDGYIARFVVTGSGQYLPNPLTEYSPPSIATMQVNEGAPNAMLVIDGQFPPQTGTVTVGSAKAPVTSWSTGEIDAALPPSAAGDVVVTSNGVPSNAAPLTEWVGHASYVEKDTLTGHSGIIGNGTGSGTLKASVKFFIRADVHPVVGQIESSPVPQALYFSDVAAPTTGSVTAAQGTLTFKAQPKPIVLTFSLGAGAPMRPGYFLGNGTFDVLPAFEAKEPPPKGCNAGLPGPQPYASAPFCVQVNMSSLNAVTCTDNYGGAYCGHPPTSGFSFTSAVYVVNENSSIPFALDRTAYTMSATAHLQPSTFGSSPFGYGTVTPSLTFSFDAPIDPPTTFTPAYRSGP